MERSKLRTVLSLLNLHLLWMFVMFLRGHSAPNREDGEITEALHESQSNSGRKYFTFSKVLKLIQFSFFGLYQNLDLQTRVNYLEGCECVRQQCVWEGREVEEGRRWQVDPNTVCLCSSGKVTCQTSKRDCEYESEVYVNGQKFSSLTDPCLLCRCSVSGNMFSLCYGILMKLDLRKN
uniref:VWFC domain-containing protein n=1 Tax=Xiphophorus maculatus TaxID=8083 RepID=A0A3B5QER3_XIPMA